MSTRACYTFTDGSGSFHVYKHHDGYPEGKHGGVAAIAATFASRKAWPLPRFEADDAAAAFVATHKDSGGGVRLSGGPATHGDIEYVYSILCDVVGVWVDVREAGGKCIFSGPLADAVTKFKATP